MAIVLSGTTGIDAGSLPVNNCGNTEVEGNLNLSGTGTRITGDFSNATLANRVMFQSSVTNGGSALDIIPNGTSNYSGLGLFADSSLTNGSYLEINISSAEARLNSSRLTAAGMYQPMTFYTGGSERMRIDTAGNVGIGTVPMRKFHIHDATLPVIQLTNSTTGNTDANRGGLIYQNSTSMYITNKENGFVYLGNNALSQVQISPTGDLQLTSGTGALGYGTGSGGTVTQLTSKSTAVTLNKPSGQITMNNASLAAGASVYFTVNNITVDVNSIAICSIIGDGSIAAVNNYEVIGIGCVNGYFWVRLTNKSASSLSEAVKVQFDIIKGATV